MLSELKSQISALQSKKSEVQTKLDHLNSEFEKVKKSLLGDLDTVAGNFTNHFDQRLEDHKHGVENMLTGEQIYNTATWESPKWQDWKPEMPTLKNHLYVGRLEERSTQTDTPYSIPAYVPFIGHNKTLILRGNEKHVKEILDVMHSMAIRIAMMLPHVTMFNFIDPSGFGKAFPIANQLPNRESSGDTYRSLESVMNDMSRVIRQYGLADHKTFDSVAKNIMINEPLEFIFAANFPKKYDRRTIERLQSIGNNGPVAGKYLIIHHNSSVPLPHRS